MCKREKHESQLFINDRQSTVLGGERVHSRGKHVGCDDTLIEGDLVVGFVVGLLVLV